MSTQPACRHCGDPLVQTQSNREWTHDWGNGSTLYRCNRNVAYGHNAAHPDVPCESLGPINVCACVVKP